MRCNTEEEDHVDEEEDTRWKLNLANQFGSLRRLRDALCASYSINDEGSIL